MLSPTLTSPSKDFLLRRHLLISTSHPQSPLRYTEKMPITTQQSKVSLQTPLLSLSRPTKFHTVSMPQSGLVWAPILMLGSTTVPILTMSQRARSFPQPLAASTLLSLSSMVSTSASSPFALKLQQTSSSI
jgi:hypothetical protein